MSLYARSAERVGKASGVRCPACNGYCKGYPVKCRHCGRVL
jgi:hypothetical protein